MSVRIPYCKDLHFTLFILLAVSLGSPLLFASELPVARAVVAPLDEIHEWSATGGLGGDVYRVDLASAGVLNVEVADLAGQPMTLRLGPIGLDGAPGGAPVAPRVVRPYPQRAVVWARVPGTYLVHVYTDRSSARGRGGGRYRMEVGFAALPSSAALDLTAQATTVSPSDTSDGGSADGTSSGDSSGGTVDEWDDDDVSLTAEPNPQEAGRGATPLFVPVCGLARPDDHGESFPCATAVPLGSRLVGRLERDFATDFDTFSFVLAKPATVRLETRGEPDTHGRLFDASGALVAEDDDGGEGVSFLLLRSLPAGRYFLRVEGVGGAQGPYVLETAVRRDEALR